MTTKTPKPEADEISERDRVRQHRCRAALDAGLVLDDAIRFADCDCDIGLLRRLQADGCPPHLIARIVL